MSRYTYHDNELYNRNVMESALDWEERQRRLYRRGKEKLGDVKDKTIEQVISIGMNEELKEGVNENSNIK